MSSNVIRSIETIIYITRRVKTAQEISNRPIAQHNSSSYIDYSLKQGQNIQINLAGVTKKHQPTIQEENGDLSKCKYSNTVSLNLVVVILPPPISFTKNASISEDAKANEFGSFLSATSSSSGWTKF